MKIKRIRHFFLFSFLITFNLFYFCSCSVQHPTPPSSSTPHPDKLKPYKIMGKWYYPIPNSHGFTQEGRASWYGEQFHGKKTANGEVYNMYKMTAAHKTLPLGTYVRVRNVENNKEIVVRVNDRGPFVTGRIIDLSYTAAKKLDMVGPGTAPVKLWALGTINPGSRQTTFQEIDYNTGNFVIQVGAFKNLDNAKRLISSLSREYENAHYVPYQTGSETFYRVRVGKCSTIHQAEKLEAKLRKKGIVATFVVAE